MLSFLFLQLSHTVNALKTVYRNYADRSPLNQFKEILIMFLFIKQRRRKMACCFILHRNLFNNHKEIVQAPKQTTHVG